MEKDQDVVEYIRYPTFDKESTHAAASDVLLGQQLCKPSLPGDPRTHPDYLRMCAKQEILNLRCQCFPGVEFIDGEWIPRP